MRSHCGKYGWHSTCTDAGLMLAAAKISRSISKVTSDKPIDLHGPSSTRRSSACQVSSNVTPEVINDLTALVRRVLVVARPKGKRGMYHIAIDIVDLQSPSAGVKGGLDPLRTRLVFHSFVVTKTS